MTSHPSAREIQQLRDIDAIADRFEGAWSSGTAPRIEDFLEDVKPEVRGALLGELLALELEWRTRLGQPVDVSEYRGRFVDETQVVDAVLTNWSKSAERTPTSDSAVRSLDSTVVPSAAPPEREAAPASNSGALGMERIGRYRILRELGAGAMGVVYLALDEELQREVALKVPKSDPRGSAGAMERFQREARAAAALQHPNICAVHDIGEADGVRYITMAYINGRPLQQLTRSGRQQPERQAALLIRKLALALQVAHSHGVVHRDLKPANILLDRNREPVIMDFGLALLTNRHEDARLTRSGTIVGSPAYMSPEQVSGDPDAVGPSSDIYSLGVIFYELVAGRLPFQGHVMAVIGQIQTANPPPLQTLRPEIDRRLEAIVLRMLARSPAERYGSMQQVADDLTVWLKEAKPRSSASPEANTLVLDPMRSATRPPSRRRRWALQPWAVGTCVAAFLALAVLFVLKTNHGDVQIEALDERIGVELDGNQITLTDRRWQGRRPPGKHRLSVLVNGTRVPIGESVPIELDGKQQRLVASLGDVNLSTDELEIQRGRTTAVTLRLIPASAPTPPAAESAPAGVASNEAPLADFRDQVQSGPAYEDHFDGDYVLQNQNSFRAALKDGRLSLDLTLPSAGSAYRELMTCDEGLVEIDVRNLTENGGPRLMFWRPVLRSSVHLWFEYGAVHFDAITPDRPSSPKVLSTQLPQPSDGGFHRVQLLIRRTSLDVAINGQRVGSAIPLPFQATPAAFSLGITKAVSGPARVEYDRVAFYPLRSTSSETPPAMAPDRIASAGEEIDLLKATSLNSMYRVGPWTQNDDGLLCGNTPPGPHKLELPVRPQGEYDLDVEFTCSGSEPSFTMRLPVPGTRVCADYSAAAYGGKAIGIAIRNLAIMELPEPYGRRPSTVTLDTRHRATARIRKHDTAWSITGLIDDQELVRWQGPPVELTLHEYWRTPDMSRPVIGQWGLPNVSLAIHSARLKVISGECHVLLQPSGSFQ